jgi:membrane AbrB-like protein
LSGLPPTGSALPAVAGFDATRPVELLVLVSGSVIGALLAWRAGVPGGLLIGSLIASAILHGTGLVTVGLPAPVLLACFVALGAMMGLRFAGTDGAMLRRLGLAALAAFAVSVSVAGALALVVSWGLDLAPAGVIVAFAPGALEVMMILAFALHLDVAYVGAHHVVRFLSIALVLPVFLRAGQKSSAEPLKPLDD